MSSLKPSKAKAVTKKISTEEKKKPDKVKKPKSARAANAKNAIKSPKPNSRPKTPQSSRKGDKTPVAFDFEEKEEKPKINFGKWSSTKEFEESINEKLADLEKMEKPDYLINRNEEENNKNDSKVTKVELSSRENMHFIEKMFASFQTCLMKQKKKLLAEFEQKDDSKEKCLYFDEDGVKEYIANIGHIEFKTFEQLREQQEKETMFLKEVMDLEKIVNEEQAKSAVLRSKVEEEYREIDDKKIYIETNLKKVQPLIAKAKESVLGIEKKHVDELRALRQPPHLVRTVMRSGLFFVNGEKYPEDAKWQDVKKNVTYYFVQSILDFDTLELLTAEGEKKVKYLQKHFFQDPEYNYDRAMIASKVAGPMVEFIKSQVEYAQILLKVKPMIEEIDVLRAELAESEVEVKRVVELDDKLQAQLRQCRTEMLSKTKYKKIGNRYFV